MHSRDAQSLKQLMLISSTRKQNSFEIFNFFSKSLNDFRKIIISEDL